MKFNKKNKQFEFKIKKKQLLQFNTPCNNKSKL